MKVWRARALVIPDWTLRQDAFAAISEKRGNIDGAALFWILPKRRCRDLIRLLVTYEVLADFLDCVSERGAAAGTTNGIHLHRALIEALDPSLEISDYYRHNAVDRDGGFLRALVEECRRTCILLPSYDVVKKAVIETASLAQIALALNHEPDPSRRNTALKRWAETEFSADTGLSWWELTAGASAWLTVLALLALGANEKCKALEVDHTKAAYLPWISLSGTMLDSYSDLAEDISKGDHSYVGHYKDTHFACRRIAYLLRRSATEARSLPDGHKHVIIVSSMAAMYLSKKSVSTPMLVSSTRVIVESGGSLTKLLFPILKIWRFIYGQ